MDMHATAADRINAAKGPTAGFDYLRLGLATTILLWHSVVTSYGLPTEASIWVPPAKGFISLLLPMFFSLSGFLVTGSLVRMKAVVPFITLRALRIVPALLVEVTLCALILGPVFTNLTLPAYFHDPQFWSYFKNVMGWIHFKLPGVFEQNPYNKAVNVSLWTIPYELECYSALVLLQLLKIIQHKYVLLFCVILGHFAIFANDARHGFQMPLGGSVPPRMLVLCFFCGVTLFQFRDKVPSNLIFAAVAIFASAFLLNWSLTTYLTPPLVAYATMAIGLTRPWRMPVIFEGDYSYGIYLYAFPIEQSFAFCFPHLRHWWISILFCLPATALFAAFSWHFIEKNVLKLKKYIGIGRPKLSFFREWSRR